MMDSSRQRGASWAALVRVALTLLILMGLGSVGLARWLLVDLPSPDRLYAHASSPSTRIYDRDGRLLYEILDPHKGAHTPISLTEIPDACVEATIATEDASYYSNPGVDLLAIVRALWINMRGGEVLSGGSTITQQLARNLLLLPEERSEITLERKAREAILAWRLTRRYSKDEILTLYLNESYYGNLAYGIEAAAETYFAKHATELDLAECSLLAGLPQSPVRYNPLENPAEAKARQQVVLGLMVKHGYITAAGADRALREELGFASAPFPIEAPHFVMYVRGQLERELGLEAIYTRGLQVYTTLDLDANRAVERAMRFRLEQLADTRQGEPARNVHNAAVVAIDPLSGEVLAMVGSPDYFDPSIDGAVNATMAARQPGSSIKPITYAAAMDPSRPNPLTTASMIVDVRTAFVTREGTPYVPLNYDYRWHGPVLLREALASSNNLAAVKVLDYVGVDTMISQARAMGITTFDEAGRFGLALTLGGGEVRLLELTAAYGAFANGGNRVEPVTILRIEDSRGRTIVSPRSGIGGRVMDERVAYLITDILSDNTARMSAFGEGSPLHLTRPAAAKTGTTTDWRDNWTVGYTPDLVVGVWAGNADNEPMRHVSGVAGAAPIWHDVVESLLKGKPETPFSEPAGLARFWVCADSGLLPADGGDASRVAGHAAVAESTPSVAARRESPTTREMVRCPKVIEEVFVDGTEPTRVDDWHWLYRLDERNGLLVGPDCPPAYVTEKRYTIYPAELGEWARRQGVPTPPDRYSEYCPQKVGEELYALAEGPEVSSDRGERMDLVLTSPDQGSRYRLSSEIPASQQRLAIQVRPVDGVLVEEVTLIVDDIPLATLSDAPYRTFWTMIPGRHEMRAEGVDRQGRVLLGGKVVIEIVH
jgi:1A family penicillin-binding protein